MRVENFVVRWYVPALNTWIDVSSCRTLEQAHGSEMFFRKAMKDSWKGDLQVSIVKVVEEEV